MKFLTYLFLGFTFSSAYSQPTSTIEVAVEETVQLKPTSVKLRIAALPEYEQKGYDDYGFGGSSLIDQIDAVFQLISELDEEYNIMRDESPEKITKKMEQEHEQNEQLREQLTLLLEENEEDSRLSFKGYHNSDVLRLLTTNNYKYTLVNNDNDLFSLSNYYQWETDTIIEVVIE